MTDQEPMSLLLRHVADGIACLADLERGDVLLYRQPSSTMLELVAQAAPRSVPPIYETPLLERTAPTRENPAVASVLAGRKEAIAQRPLAGHRSPIMQRAYPVVEGSRRIGVLVIEKSLVEHERHAIRRRPFRLALRNLRRMVLKGEARALASLSPFRETDGIMLVDQRGIITYVSGRGSYLYRQLGYSEELIGKPVHHLETADARLVEQSFAQSAPLEEELMEGERIWLRKVIPIRAPRRQLPRPLSRFKRDGFGERQLRTVMILIHDATAARRKAEEQLVRKAMVQEIHHRVKNNLQTVASLLRIQTRRTEGEATKRALTDATNRILSVAVVHEFLSQHEQRINLRNVARRIVRQVHDSVLDPQQEIRFAVEGDSIFLQAQQTTMVALILNELLLNALEHGFRERGAGRIEILFDEEGDDVQLTVRDDGAGLPSDFNLEQANSLGLTIVQTIVQQDLKGEVQLQRTEEGQTEAVVRFRKAPPERFG